MSSVVDAAQDKRKERDFFDNHAVRGEYDVFTDESNHRLISQCLALAGLRSPGLVADLGCASGVFAQLLIEAGFRCVGLDISPAMTTIGSRRFPAVRFVTGDIEQLPFPDSSLDGVLLSGVIHHFPSPHACAREVHRVLKPRGAFMAFDPNRLNPFMYLYRDRSSPFYSRVGVTENERPVLARKVKAVFTDAGFDVTSSYLSGLQYRYVASGVARRLLPAYNAIDALLFAPAMFSPLRAFVLTAGRKRPKPQHA